MDEHMYPNFETLCRLCLRAEAATVRIFQSDSATNSQPSIPVRIMACAALEVLLTDELPKVICAECRYQLEKSYYFRKRSQLSDSKLKKHMRLLNLGKKSRIFSRTEDEDFEDELEFEDSLRFLKEKDEELEREATVKNERWKAEMKEFLRMELREEVEDKVREELQESVREEVCRSLKSTLRNEIRAELRDEVVAEVRESLRFEVRQECIEEAKAELHDEVLVKCQEEERKSLLDELNNFLTLQRGKHVRNRTMMDQNTQEEPLDSDEVVVPVILKVGTVKNGKEAEKRSNDSLLLSKTKKIKHDSQTASGSSENEISSTEQPLAFVAVPGSEQEDGTDGTESNFYIVEGGDDSVDQEEDEQEVNTFFSYDEAVNFQITPSESSDYGGTTYQIEENGELKFFKKEININGSLNNDEAEVENEDDIEDENVLIYDPDNGQDENSNQDVEQDDYESQTLSLDKISSKANVESTIKRTIASMPIVINSQSGSSVITSNVMKNFQCTECPRLFTRQVSMLRHIAMHRVLEKRGVSYKCPNCRIILSCKSALNRHMMKHTGSRPHVCDECGKSFIQREILKRHRLTHSGVRPYDCPHCDRSFSQKLNLTQHINSCHSENPRVQQYSCHMCPKRFNHASGLSRHLATHSGVSFQCTECDRTFTDRSSVKRHIVHVHGIGSIEKTVQQKSNTEPNRMKHIDTSL